MKRVGLLLLVAVLELFALEKGEKVSYIELAGNNGGYLDGKKYKSSDMDAKTNIVFYVDPDMKDLNDDFAEELEKLHLNSKKLKVFVIINMQASWIPNVLIDSVLDSKQKKFPDAHYAKDNDKILVKKWGLEDNNYDVVMINKNGNVVFSYRGKIASSLSKEIIGKL